jgi:hypothetical protein
MASCQRMLLYCVYKGFLRNIITKYHSPSSQDLPQPLFMSKVGVPEAHCKISLLMPVDSGVFFYEALDRQYEF